MMDHGKSKKGCDMKKLLVLAGVLASFCLHAGTGQKGNFVFGAYTGLTKGFTPEFDWHYTGATSHNYTPNYHLGGYLQYNLSDRFSLQFSLNYQNGDYDWVFHPWSGGEETGTERFSIVSYSLNGVIDYAKLKGARLYLLAGAGLGNGNNTYHFDESFFIFTGGTGIRIYLSQKSRSAVNLGCTYHHLWDSEEYSDDHANLVRLNIGFEFSPHARGD